MGKVLYLFLFLLVCFSVNGQVGFVLLKDTVPGMPHIQVKDIHENSIRRIELLGEAKNEKITQTTPWFMEVNSKGQPLSKKHFTQEISAVKRILPISPSSNRVYGMNVAQGGLSKMFAETIDSKKTPTFESIPSEISVVYGDALSYSNTHTVIIQSTRKTGTKIFNLQLVKTLNESYTATPFATLESKYTEMCMQAAMDTHKNFYITGIRLIDDSIVPFVYALDSLGNKKWEYLPPVSKGFENLKISVDAFSASYVTASFRDNKQVSCWTDCWKIDAKGNLVLQKRIDSIKSNGHFFLQNGQLIFYGTRYLIHDKRFIMSKGNFVIVNPMLEIQVQDQLQNSDEPDFSFPKTTPIQPTSSEFTCGTQLKDGRIVLAGRVTFPEFTDEKRIADSKFYNQACLLFISEAGKFRK